MKKKKPKLEPNLVAKYANTFNHARTFRDKKNDYKRSSKHKGGVPYDQIILNILELFGHKKITLAT